MRTSVFFLAVASFCLAFTSCAPPERIDEARLRSEVQAFIDSAGQHWNGENVEATLADYATDAVVFANGTDMTATQDSLRAVFTRYFEMASDLIWKPEITKAFFPSSKAAVVTMKYTYSFLMEGKKSEEEGTQTFYLVKSDAGWKIQHEHYSRQSMESEGM